MAKEKPEGEDPDQLELDDPSVRDAALRLQDLIDNIQVDEENS